MIDTKSVALTGITGGAIYGMAETLGLAIHVEPPQAALVLCLMAAVVMAEPGWWKSLRQILITAFAALALMVTALGANKADTRLQNGGSLLVRPAEAQSAPTPPPTPIVWKPRRPW